VLVLVLGLLGASSLPSQAGQTKRPFTVQDGLAFSNFGVDPDSAKPSTIVDSPQRNFFAFVTTKGLLASNNNESTLWLLSRNEIKSWLSLGARSSGPTPRKIAEVSASAASDGFAVGSRDTITDVRWLPDERSLTFLGRTEHGGHAVYLVELAHGNPRQLTPNDKDVISYSYAPNTDTLLFSATSIVTDEDFYQAGGSTLPFAQVGPGVSEMDMIFPNWAQVRSGSSVHNLWIVQQGSTKPVLDPDTTEPLRLELGFPLARILSLSPSGKYAIAVRPINIVPQEWQKYLPASPEMKFKAGEADPAHNILTPTQLILIDVKDGSIHPLVNAPLGWGAGYFLDRTVMAWSTDEEVVAVSNVFYPPQAGGRLFFSRPCILVVALKGRQVTCVREFKSGGYGSGWPATMPHFISHMSWFGADSAKLTVTFGSYLNDEDTLTETFQRQGKAWTAADSIPSVATDNELRVRLDQSIDSPPAVAVRLSSGTTWQRLWDPNPQLGTVALGHATEFQWKDDTGHAWSGGLVKPVGFTPGHRYPLVIQTHGFDKNRYLLDGFESTANAARALAGRGFVVLQVAESGTAPMATPSEAELDGRRGYDAAIKRLSSDGLIDRHRVGIVGFSRTGWYVLHSLVTSPQTFRASILADPVTETLGQYFTTADEYGGAESLMWSNSIGAKPFGSGLQIWLKSSPGFQTDKIMTPILIQINSARTVPTVWDLYAMLRLQEKPVDLLYLRNANHVLNRPLEMFVSQEMAVDWFDFWLNRHIDPNPAKRSQYARWEGLCDLAIKQGGKDQTFCVPSGAH